jgi:hypothetical protein
MKDLFIHALNDYQVTESGYFSNLYHVRSRDLTDGRTDSGGWGSETAKTGNYIQATFLRPVYVTSVTVAGGFIPSWGHDIRRGWQLKLEYSVDGTTWNKVIKIFHFAFNVFHLYVARNSLYSIYGNNICNGKDSHDT